MDLGSASKDMRAMEKVQTINELLHKKRMEIGRDIAEFTARKEKEYAAFEEMLRTRSEEGAREKELQDEATMRDFNDNKEVTRSHRKNGVPHIVNEIFQAERNGVGFQNSSATNISQQSLSSEQVGRFEPINIESPSNSTAPKGTPVHEREAEFRGLFTPSYLPLLDSSTHDYAIGPRKPLNSSARSEGEQRPSRDSASIIVSKAIRPTTAISASASPENNHTFLVNTPPEESFLRTSSSRSDTFIGSRRSSLRDPRHPRSSKRVLFSIDNVLVSPSTAPAKRSMSSINQAHSPELDNVPQCYENIAASTATDESRSRNLSRGSSREDRSSSPSIEGNTLHRFRPFRHSLNLKGGAPIFAGDDFETVDYEDDLFTFDEDLDIGEMEHAEKSEGNLRSDEEEEDKKGVDISSSPHAGSLPIEIKWPVRPDPRK